MRYRRCCLSLVLALALAVPALAASGLRFDKSEYAARRPKLMEKLGGGIGPAPRRPAHRQLLSLRPEPTISCT